MKLPFVVSERENSLLIILQSYCYSVVSSLEYVSESSVICILLFLQL